MSIWDGKSILIVDDNQDIRRQLSEAYKSLGLNVIGEAEDGVKAIEFIATNEPDIVSLDIIMPEMDGIECYRKIRASNESIQMLVVSCLAADPKVVESFSQEIPPYVFVGKPVEAEKLKDHLDLLFNHGQTITLAEAEAAKEEPVDATKIPDINQIA
jgi:two-component system chemotaxis response regulator CheY